MGGLVTFVGQVEPKGAKTAPDYSFLSVESGKSFWAKRTEQGITILTNGQTNFITSFESIDDEYRRVEVNGVDETHNFTFSGVNVTAVSLGYNLEPSDNLRVRYHYK